MIGWLMILALAVIAVGFVLILFRTSWAAPVARAVIVSGVGLGLTDLAFAQGWSAAWWLSGFGICAAIHRWIDVFLGRESFPIVPKVAADLATPGAGKAPNAKHSEPQQKPKA